jgi:hypothetical protein
MILTASAAGVPTSGSLGLPEHLEWSIVLAIAVSFILAAIEINGEVRKTFRCCLIPQSFLYVFLLVFGNVVTTLLAAVLVEKLSPSLSAWFWFFAVFFGVFAFEAILKNTNITLLDKGVLTIQDWIKKALTGAAAAAVAKDVQLNDRETGQLAAALAQVPESRLNAFAAIKLTTSSVTSIVPQLDAAAAANNADPMLYKAYAIASALSPSVVRAFLAQNLARNSN